MAGTLADLYKNLQSTIAGAEPDVTKTVNGNAAAARRVRKVMQEVKSTAQEIRKAALADEKEKAEKAE